MSDSFKRAVIAVTLLIFGVALQAMTRSPPVALGSATLVQLTEDGKIDKAFLDAQLAFVQERARYIEALSAPYDDYRGAFLLARSTADFPKIKAAIDGEIAANEAIEERGLGAVPGLTGEALTRPSLWLIALAAAVAFQSFAFAMGGAFLGGLLHAMAAELNTLTGLPAEYYLASILAALLVAAAGWWALQRLWRAPPA